MSCRNIWFTIYITFLCIFSPSSRLYLINSPVVRAENLRFKEEGVRDVLKDVLLPWYNAYRFFIQNVLRLHKVWLAVDCVKMGLVWVPKAIFSCSVMWEHPELWVHWTQRCGECLGLCMGHRP